MPMGPQGRVALVPNVSEPMLVNMQMPAQRRGKLITERGKLIDQLNVGEDQCAFFPLPADMTPIKFGAQIGSLMAAAKKRNTGAQYERRTTKCGVVEGIGVWRTE